MSAVSIVLSFTVWLSRRGQLVVQPAANRVNKETVSRGHVVCSGTIMSLGGFEEHNPRFMLHRKPPG